LGLERPDEAVALIDAIVVRLESTGRLPLPAALRLRNASAGVLLLCGRYAEAEAEWEEIARVYRGLPEPGGTITAAYFDSRTGVCSLIGLQGRFGRALSAADALLPQVVAALGAGSAQAYRTRMQRAFALAMLGRYGEAAAECEALLAAGTGQVTEGDWTLTACGLAYCLVEQDRAAEAEAVLRDPLAAAERDDPAGPSGAKLRREMANVLVRQGRCEEALALVAGPPVWGLDDPGYHQLVRATALLGLGRPQEAEAAAVEALAAAARVPPAHLRVLEIRTVLARIHGSPDEWDSVTADWAAHHGPDHPRAQAAARH
jgi:tetratricopeptide (TPR) repeat protein